MAEKRICPKCGTKRISNVDYCRNCNYFFNITVNQDNKPQRVIIDNNKRYRVVIEDIRMEFSSMVAFMVKWAIASIPALIILGFIGMALLSVFAGFSIFN